MAKKRTNNRPKREVDFELAAKVVLVLSVIGIIVSTVLMFTPPISGEEYAELGLLTYNSSEQKYEADNYPSNVIYSHSAEESANISLFILLGNHYDRAKYFEVRLKIGLQTVLINEDVYGTNETTYFHENHWKQKMLDIDEQWTPSSQTEFNFKFTKAILDKLGTSSTGYKIIFELWEWNSQLDDFTYTGVHTYLTSFKLVIIS